nr:MAG TPA: hypothetical protein [Caudoviricetes sp.]
MTDALLIGLCIAERSNASSSVIVAVARRAAMTHFSSSVKVICSAVMTAPSSRVAGVNFRLLPE